MSFQKGSKRLLAIYLQTLLAYPDGCTRDSPPPHTRAMSSSSCHSCSEEKLYPKEQVPVDLAAAERMEGKGW